MTTAEHGEVGTRGQALGRQMHDPAVRDVGVGEDRQVDSFALDELDDVGLGNDRDPVGIERAGQLRGISPVVDVRDLGGGEGDYAIRRIVAKHDVDVVEVTTRCAEDDYRGRAYHNALRGWVEHRRRDALVAPRPWDSP